VCKKHCEKTLWKKPYNKNTNESIVII
jgi:hypothetical protein